MSEAPKFTIKEEVKELDIPKIVSVPPPVVTDEFVTKMDWKEPHGQVTQIRSNDDLEDFIKRLADDKSPIIWIGICGDASACKTMMSCYIRRRFVEDYLIPSFYVSETIDYEGLVDQILSDLPKVSKLRNSEKICQVVGRVNKRWKEEGIKILLGILRASSEYFDEKAERNVIVKRELSKFKGDYEKFLKGRLYTPIYAFDDILINLANEDYDKVLLIIDDLHATVKSKEDVSKLVNFVLGCYRKMQEGILPRLVVITGFNTPARPHIEGFLNQDIIKSRLGNFVIIDMRKQSESFKAVRAILKTYIIDYTDDNLFECFVNFVYRSLVLNRDWELREIRDKLKDHVGEEYTFSRAVKEIFELDLFQTKEELVKEAGLDEGLVEHVLGKITIPPTPPKARPEAPAIGYPEEEIKKLVNRVNLQAPQYLRAVKAGYRRFLLENCKKGGFKFDEQMGEIVADFHGKRIPVEIVEANPDANKLSFVLTRSQEPEDFDKNTCSFNIPLEYSFSPQINGRGLTGYSPIPFKIVLYCMGKEGLDTDEETFFNFWRERYGRKPLAPLFFSRQSVLEPVFDYYIKNAIKQRLESDGFRFDGNTLSDQNVKDVASILLNEDKFIAKVYSKLFARVGNPSNIINALVSTLLEDEGVYVVEERRISTTLKMKKILDTLHLWMESIFSVFDFVTFDRYKLGVVTILPFTELDHEKQAWSKKKEGISKLIQRLPDELKLLKKNLLDLVG